jgi:hypothetical protein
MEKEYIIAFSSFYNTAYAQDVLMENGIRTTMRKLPTQIAKSCSTGLYVRSGNIREVENILRSRNIFPRGIYEIGKDGKYKI